MRKVMALYKHSGRRPMSLICRRSLSLALSGLILLSFSFFGYAQANTTTSLSSNVNPSVFGQSVQFIATVTVLGGSTQTPSGTVTFYDGVTSLGSNTLTSSAPYETALDVSTLSVGWHEITAVYGGDADTNPSTSDPLYQTVNKANTTLSISSHNPDPSVAGQPYTVMGQVQATWPGSGTPTGTVTVNDGGGNSCAANLVGGFWSCTLTSTSVGTGTKTLTAVYEGDENFKGSSISITGAHTVNKRDTTTTVMGSETSLSVISSALYTVTVSDTSSGSASIPTGTVSFSVSPGGVGTLNPANGTLDAAGQCTFRYTPTNGFITPHTITVSYGGDSTHNGSNGSFQQAVAKRNVDMQLNCAPSTAFIGQEVTCQVHVEDDTTEGGPAVPQGTVTFDDDGKTGIFTVGGVTDPTDTWALDASGDLTVTYTPGAWDEGTTTITATYDALSLSIVHKSKSTTQQLTINLRPTETTVDCLDEDDNHDAMLVNETGECTVVVKDASGVALPSGWPQGPVGTVKITSSLESAGMGAIFPAEITYDPFGPGSGGESQVSFPYGCTSLENDGDLDTIGAIYSAVGGIYADSAGGYAQAIYRRLTETTLDCAATDDGYTCTTTVKEKSGLPGTPSWPQGKIVDVTDDSDFCTPLVFVSTSESSCGPKAVDTDALMANVTVRYEPNDRIHLKSAGSENVTRENAPNLPSGGGSGGVPAGAKNIDEIILGLNSGCLAATLLGLIFDASALLADATPDPVVGVGTGGGFGVVVVVVVGVTIPTSDLAAAIIGWIRIALQTYVTIATTDLDGDGLPGIVELVTHTNDTKFDTDGDGLGDGYEVTVAGGFYGPHTDPGDYDFGDTACPNPNVKDSDEDWIIDGDEGFYNTSMCDPDTDDDTLTDGQEVGTWILPDIRDHADPLMEDTDGDGLRDDVEYYMNHSCPYVNDDDSDDDGLQDGYEDKNGDGCWGDHIPGPLPWTCANDITCGDSTTQAGKPGATLWETDLCNSDTDGDGLLDGVEEGLFGTGEVSPEGVSQTVGQPGPTSGLGAPGVTVPALDSDMDNDGLTDYEEVNTYQTDPMDADTDNDMVSDYDEVATWAYADARDHSNPREADTDGDGLTDNLEIAEGCNCGTGMDGYVNDDDSDDDGLQDGREYELFGAGADVLAANGNNGELHDDTVCCLCDPDSDGDGLLDGEEDQTGTLPLDWDSDDDGLSDKEELQVYFTDPNDPDTDDDTAKGILLTRPAAIVLDGYGGSYSNILLDSDGEEALSRTGIDPFGALGDQSDPLQKDTDGDGIGDEIEFAPGCNCGAGGPSQDGYVNNADSDNDGMRDLLDATEDVPAASVNQTPTIPDPSNAGELNDDDTCGICDPDSDGDGLLDGEEHQIGTDPYDWDSDNDGRSDWEEVTGGGNTIPSDPLDFDTDDDGLGDGVEVFSVNTTNPVNADTDSDGLCDGGCFTPSAVAGIDGSGTNPLCKTGVPSHPNPYGYGEDEDGDGTITAGETNPNDPDSDDDALGDGVEKLAYSTSRQWMIPATDLLGRPITVNYPPTGSTVTYPDNSCLDPLNPDTDGDGLLDGEEDLNHDGNFDFQSSDFDYFDPLPGPPQPNPAETNPCDPDTDHDGLTDYQERHQPNPASAYPFNPTNPLDHDTDNDYIYDGPEVAYVCTIMTFENLDNDGDALFDEDPIDGIDNDGDGLIDEDPVDFTVRFVSVLDPTNRDSDSDGWMDGLDPDPCNSALIPILQPVEGEPVDSDGDGFADEDEIVAGTHPNDPDDHPTAFTADLDLDEEIDDRLWLEPSSRYDIANSVVIDINSNVLIDARIEIVAPRDVQQGDFDGDGFEDDCRYIVMYAFSNYRVLQPRILATIDDYDCDLVIDHVVVEKK